MVTETVVDKEIDIYPFFCFYTLNNKFFKNNKPLTLKEICNKSPFENQSDKISLGKVPLFVTWLKKDTLIQEDDSEESESASDIEDKDYDLRGCIGTFSRLDLEEGLREYALIAAFNDTRFPIIKYDELKYLKCKVSILQDFKIIYDKTMTDTRMHPLHAQRDTNNFWSHIDRSFHILPDDLQETNGIEIKFTYYTSKYSSTFLPEVMVENDFDLEETFDHLIKKALSRDYSKSDDLSLITKVIMRNPKEYIDKVIVYKSAKSGLTYKQFKKVLDNWEL